MKDKSDADFSRVFMRRVFLDPSIKVFPPDSNTPKLLLMEQLGLIDQNGNWDEDRFSEVMDTLDEIIEHSDDHGTPSFGRLMLVLQGEISTDGQIIGDKIALEKILTGLSEVQLQQARIIIAIFLLPGMHDKTMYDLLSEVSQKQIDHVEKCGRWLVSENPLKGLDIVKAMVTELNEPEQQIFPVDLARLEKIMVYVNQHLDEPPNFNKLATWLEDNTETS